MSPQSLLIILTHPPQVRLQDALLEDYVSSKIDDTPVFATVPPWSPMHDLLVDRETQTLAGIVYPVAAREQAPIAAICQSLPALQFATASLLFRRPPCWEILKRH